MSNFVCSLKFLSKIILSLQKIILYTGVIKYSQILIFLRHYVLTKRPDISTTEFNWSILEAINNSFTYTVAYKKFWNYVTVYYRHTHTATENGSPRGSLLLPWKIIDTAYPARNSSRARESGHKISKSRASVVGNETWNTTALTG